MNKERGVGIAIIIIAIIMLILTSLIEIPGLASSGDIGSKFFPSFASIGLLLCGIGIVITGKAEPDAEPFFPEGGLKRAVILIGVLLVYVLLLQYVGFLISSPILLYAMITLLAGDTKIKPIPKIIFSIVMTVAMYWFFVKLLSILLPNGVLF